MTITVSGSGTISGITSGGLGANPIITQPEIVTGVAGVGPAFSAYQSSAQTLASNTFTKIQFQTKTFDTASAFDNTTNYRFQPLVAGYYYVSGMVQVGVGATAMFVTVYKNGSEYQRGPSATGNQNSGSVTSLVYLNGSTDYIELYSYLGTGQALTASSALTYFQAAMVRAA